MVLNTDGAPIIKRTKTQKRADSRRRQKAAARGPDWVAPEARANEAGPPKRREKNVTKRLRNKMLKAACKAAEQATELAGDAAGPSQEPAFHWQRGKKVSKLEPTLPAAERLAAAKAVLSSLPPAQLLQVDDSRHRAIARGIKRAREAGGHSTGQTHPHPHTHAHKSRRISRVGGDSKRLAQDGSHDEESAPEAAAKEVELLAVVVDKQGVSSTNSDAHTADTAFCAEEQQPDGIMPNVSLATQKPAAVAPVLQLQSVASADDNLSQAPAITHLLTQAMAAAVTTPAAGESRHNDAALRCDGNTHVQAVGSTPDAFQQRLNGGGLATGTRPAAAAMDVAAVAVKGGAAAESAEATHMEEAAAPEAEAAAAATEVTAVPEAVAAATDEAAAAEAGAAATDEAAAPEAAAIDEAAAPEAEPSVARASQLVPDTEDEAQCVFKQTSSESHRACPSSHVQLTAVEGCAAALGVEGGAEVERLPDLHALQGCVPDTQAAAVLQEAAYGSLAPTGPDSTPTGPKSTPTGPDSTPTGPDSILIEPDSTPTGPDSTPTGPDSTPTGPDSTTATCLGMGSEQGGDGANSGSPSVEPQISDADADPNSVGATVGIAPDFDEGDGGGPDGLGAAADPDVTDLTGPSEDFAKVDDPLRERFLSLRCFLVEPDIGPLTMDDIGAMKAIQDEAFGDEAADKDSRLVYHTRANVAVFRRDILCMKAGGWMKDEIVNMYMALLQDRDIVMRHKKLNFPRCYFFNSFFFCKLYSDTKTYSFDNVQSQVNAEMLECDKLICPVHLGKHWTCAVADYQQQTVTYYDSLWTCTNAEAIMHALLGFVDDMSQALGKTVDISAWRVRCPKKDKTPRQNNGCDCGVFALLFAEYVSRNAQFNFSQRHINAYRTKIVADVATMKIGIPLGD